MSKITKTELTQESFHDQYIYNREFKIITDTELGNDSLRLDALNDVRFLVLPIPHRLCLDYITELYRDLKGCFVDKNGEEIFLNMRILGETPDEWWRDTVQTPAPRTRAIILRTENRERLRVIFGLYRACFPERAMLWGVRPDNDNGV